MAAPALRKKALKSFCCSLCSKTYRYKPPFDKHMAKHALEDAMATSSEVTDLTSQLVAYKKDTESRFAQLVTVIAELQVSLAHEKEERLKLEDYIKSRGLRNGGLDWREMFCLKHLEKGLTKYFSSCKENVAYDSSADKGIDILWTFCQMLQFSWNCSGINSEDTEHDPCELWITGHEHQLDPWELADLVVPHLLAVLPDTTSFWASFSSLIHPSHVRSFFTALRGYTGSSKKCDIVTFRGLDRPRAVKEVITSTFGLRQWKGFFT